MIDISQFLISITVDCTSAASIRKKERPSVCCVKHEKAHFKHRVSRKIIADMKSNTADVPSRADTSHLVRFPLHCHS
jgi:hypothetical protein